MDIIGGVKMKIKELKKLAMSENLNNKPDVTKLAFIFSLLLHLLEFYMALQ
jgi:hypothetical protein